MKKENYTHAHTYTHTHTHTRAYIHTYKHTYKHVQVISNDIHDKQTADKQTTAATHQLTD